MTIGTSLLPSSVAHFTENSTNHAQEAVQTHFQVQSPASSEHTSGKLPGNMFEWERGSADRGPGLCSHCPLRLPDLLAYVRPPSLPLCRFTQPIKIWLHCDVSSHLLLSVTPAFSDHSMWICPKTTRQRERGD